MLQHHGFKLNILLALGFIFYAASCAQAPIPRITDFRIVPGSIQNGESATLLWNVSDATIIVIDNGIGEVASYGTLDVWPADTTTYTITAQNSQGVTTRTVTITTGFSLSKPPSHLTMENSYNVLSTAGLMEKCGGKIRVTGVTSDVSISDNGTNAILYFGETASIADELNLFKIKLAFPIRNTDTGETIDFGSFAGVFDCRLDCVYMDAPPKELEGACACGGASGPYESLRSCVTSCQILRRSGILIVAEGQLIKEGNSPIMYIDDLNNITLAN